MFRTVPLSIIKEFFTVNTTMVYVIQVCWQLASCQQTCIRFYYKNKNQEDVMGWRWRYKKLSYWESQGRWRQYRLWQMENNRRMWNISSIWVAWWQMMWDIQGKLSTGLSLQQQHSTRRRHSSKLHKFEEEISEMPDLELSIARCRNLDTWERGAEMQGKFWNAVLDKNGEDHLGRSCEKWRNLTWSQGKG